MKYGTESFIGGPCIREACAYTRAPLSSNSHFRSQIISESVCKWEWPSQKWTEVKCTWRMYIWWEKWFDKIGNDGDGDGNSNVAVLAAKINVERQRTDRWLKDLINNLWKAQVHGHQQALIHTKYITFKMGNLPIRRKFDRWMDGWTEWDKRTATREDNNKITMHTEEESWRNCTSFR